MQRPGLLKRGADQRRKLLVLQRAAGERPEAAEALAGFLDANSRQPLERYLREHGCSEADARRRAAAIDAFVLGVSTRRRVLRDELGDRDTLRMWLAETIQRLASALTTNVHGVG